jgi:phosphatidylglycerophosphatase A
MGTLLGFPLHWIAARHLTAWPHLGLIAALFALGIWAAGRTGRALGVADHPGIVVDEIAAFMLVLFFTPPAPLWAPFAFLLFRLFDIFKPPPIRQADESIRGGVGVMLDDLLAAFYAVLCLTLAKALLG